MRAERSRFINEEEEAEKEYRAAYFGETDPHVGLSFSAGVIVFCEGVVVF
jgi:hypothetical protein